MSQYYNDLPLTNFPNSPDTQYDPANNQTKLNISATDGQKIKEYQAFMQAGKFAEAAAKLAEIPQAVRKIITANDINTITQAILALERFYNLNTGNGIKTYVNQKQAEWLAIINQFNYISDFSNSVNYKKNNYTTYINPEDNIKRLYIATVDIPMGNGSPIDNSNWRLLTIRGQRGESGEGLTFRYAWQSSEDYSPQEIVTYNNILWVSIVENTNKQPDINPAFWQKIASLETQSIPVQTAQPTSQQVGDLWFKVVG